MLYAIIALIALAALCAWLIWRCRALGKALARARASARSMQKERAIRQNLQQVLERREAEIRRLRERMDAFESEYQEMCDRASDLNMSLFRESGLRILAEKEDGAKRLKMEQLEQQADSARRALQAHREAAEAQRQELLSRIEAQDREIARLRQAGARRMKRPPTDAALFSQVTLDDVLKPATEDGQTAGD